MKSSLRQNAAGMDATILTFQRNGSGLSVEESLRRLRTDYVDLLLADDVEFGDFNVIIGETIPTMRRLQEEGKTRFVGISGYPLSVLMTIARRTPVDCILSYCRYNLLIHDMDTVLTPFAERLRIGLINAAPLHMGMLTEAGAPDWHPAPGQVRKAVREALVFCRRRGFDLSEVGLRFCFECPHVTCTLVGMSTSDQVRKNLAAFHSRTDRVLLCEVQAILAPAANVVAIRKARKPRCDRTKNLNFDHNRHAAIYFSVHCRSGGRILSHLAKPGWHSLKSFRAC
jgi:L-galactose dehydrogenase